MFGFGCFDRLAYKKTAATARITPGKGTATALCPRRAVDCVFGVGLNLLPRLTARCRGSPRRRGELRKVWDWLF